MLLGGPGFLTLLHGLDEVDQVGGSLVNVFPAERLSLCSVVHLIDLHPEGSESAGDKPRPPTPHTQTPGSSTNLHEPEARTIKPEPGVLQGGSGPRLLGDDGSDQGGV